MIGRQRELDLLQDALEKPRAILIAGEAGMGKSRLLREFAVSAADRDHDVAWARPEVVSTPGPYSLILDLLEELASFPSARHEAHELSAAIASLSESAQPPARHIAARLRSTFGTLKRPVGIFEDLHFADDLSLAVVTHLARSAADDDLLLIGSYRPEDAAIGSLNRMLDVLNRDRLATYIDLQPLDMLDLAEMVQLLTGEIPSSDRIEQIARLGEGVPLFIEEIAAAPSASEVSIPKNVALATLSRISRLDDQAIGVVRVASLMLGSIDPRVIALACKISEAEVPRALVAAVGAGLLEDRQNKLVFRHALIGEAVADSIVSVERAAYHGRIADAIELIYGKDLDEHARALARHLDGAGRFEEAARWWVVAGARAFSRGALEESKTQVQAALAHASGEVALDAKACEARLRSRTGDDEGALTIYRLVADAHEKAGRMNAAVLVLQEMGRTLGSRQDPRLVETFDEALSLLGRAEPLFAQTLVLKGAWLVDSLGRSAEAEPLLREGLELARRVGDEISVARALFGLSLVAERSRDSVESEALGRQAAEVALRTGSDELIGITYLGLAQQLSQRGRISEALSVLEKARSHFVRTFNMTWFGSLDRFRAQVLWRAGQPAEAEKQSAMLEGVRWANQFGRLVRVWAVSERGDASVAHGILKTWWDEIGGPEFRAECLANPERIPLHRVDAHCALLAELIACTAFDEGADRLRAIEPYALSAPGGDFGCAVRTTYARALIGLERHDEALSILDGLAELAAKYPLYQAVIAELRSMVCDKPGFLEAESLYKETEHAIGQVRCRRLYAQTIADVDKKAAIESLRDAAALGRSIGATVEVNHCESALRDLGVRPRAGRPRGSGVQKGSLSDREEEVVALLAGGATNHEISARLFLSERTVRDHIASAQRRLGVTGRPALVAWAIKRGLV